VESAAGRVQANVQTLEQGDVVSAGDCQMEILWPPTAHDLGQRNVIVLCRYKERRILIADPGMADVLATLAVQCDAIVFTGAERGGGDAALRRVAEHFGARQLIWCGRGSWASRSEGPGNWNTRDEAIIVEVSEQGEMDVFYQ
jgi:hypothetical protein